MGNSHTIQPINIASVDVLRQLDAIEPGVWGTPCSVVLLDGRSITCSLVWENRRYSDAGEWINPADVAYLVESPLRMPARFAHQINAAGESGMGYHLCVVHLSDGKSFVHVAANLTIDVVDLPPNYTQKDIIGVEPHLGRERSATEGYRESIQLIGLPVEFVRQST